jgi:hypothetical protein
VPRILISLVAVLAVSAIACGGASAANPPASTEIPAVYSTIEAVPPTPVIPPTTTPVPTQVPTPTPTAVALVEQINLTPQWFVGQKWNYELAKMQTRDSGAGTIRNLGSASVIEIEILEANPDGYVLGYTLKSVELPDTGQIQGDDLLNDLAELTIDLTYEIEVSAEAVILGIRNFDEIKTIVNTGIDQVVEAVQISASPGESAELQVLFDQIRANYASENEILAFGLPELNLFLLPFGWDVDIAEVYEIEDALPSPLGGPPIPANALFEVLDPVPADTQYTFNWSQGFSGPLAEQALFESLMILSLQIDGPQPTFDDVRGIERQDNGTFVIDVEDWTLTGLAFDQQVTNQDTAITDTTELTLLP